MLFVTERGGAAGVVAVRFTFQGGRAQGFDRRPAHEVRGFMGSKPPSGNETWWPTVSGREGEKHRQYEVCLSMTCVTQSAPPACAMETRK